MSQCSGYFNSSVENQEISVESRINRVCEIGHKGQSILRTGLVLCLISLLCLGCYAISVFLDKNMRWLLACAAANGLFTMAVIVCSIVNRMHWSNQVAATLADIQSRPMRSDVEYEFVIDILQHYWRHTDYIVDAAEEALVSLIMPVDDEHPPLVKPRFLPGLYSIMQLNNDRLIAAILMVIDVCGTQDAVPCLQEKIRIRANRDEDTIYPVALETLAGLEARCHLMYQPHTLLRPSASPNDKLLKPSCFVAATEDESKFLLRPRHLDANSPERLR